jgi:hypothetical protein
VTPSNVTWVDAFTNTAMLESPAFAPSGAWNDISSTSTAASAASTSRVKLGEIPVTTGIAAFPE